MSSGQTQAKQRLRSVIAEMEANKPEQEPSVMGDIENDDDSLSLNDKQVKFLKRQARKRKWVRRCRKCNDYLHAICKSYTHPIIVC